jgi:phospholipid transport system substrate-binding protein
MRLTGMRLLYQTFLCALVLISSATPWAALSPTAVIEWLHQSLIETMKDAQRLGIDGRYKQLQPILEKSFDFERMIAVAAGSYWTSADEAQRRRLLDAFTDLSVATYAARFNGFSGESFETLGQRQGPRDMTLVDTRIVRTDGPPVPITYVMAERDGEWRIVDVLLDKSISELAVRRSEYNQVLRTSGTEGLTETLDEKAAELRKQ